MKHSRREFRFTDRVFLPTLLLFLLAAPNFAQGRIDNSFIVPPAYAEMEGELSINHPFDRNPGRFQYIVSTSLIPIFPVEGVYLTGIKFRSDGNSFPGLTPVTLNYVNLFISTTEKQLAEASPIFDANHGSDKLLVLSAIGLSVIVDSPPGNEPSPFSIELNFQKPFYYKNASRNLVIEFLSQADGTSINLDFTTDRRMVSLSDSTLPGPFVSPGGLVTTFTYVPVPEVSPTVIFLLGEAIFIFLFIKRRASK